MSSYSEYLSRQKQRVTKYLDTRPHRDAGHQTEIVKRLAASGVQDSKTPNRMGNIVLNGPSTQVNSFYAKAHTVQDASTYNDYSSGQAVAQSEKPENQKAPQIEVTCCSPPEINDRLAADEQYALIYNARQGVRRNCCYKCGKVYDAAVCGCINRVPQGPQSGCNYDSINGMVLENLEVITGGDSAPYDDYGWYLSFGFPFYFNNTDYGSLGQVYLTSNYVIGFGDNINTSYSGSWNTDNQAILIGWDDRDLDSIYSGPYVQTLGNLTYHQLMFYGHNEHGDDIPNAVNYRIIFGRDEVAGYQYIELQFEKVPELVGVWDMSYDGELTGIFGSFQPQACTTLLLRSDLSGIGWEVLYNQTLGVPTTTIPPGGSLFFDRQFAPGPAPVSAWLTIPQNEDEFSLGTNDFTVEWWQKWNDDGFNNTTPYVFNLGSDVFGAYWDDSGSGNRQLTLMINGDTYGLGGSLPIDGVWIHVSISRISGTIYLHLNGNLHADVTNGAEITTTDDLVIGQNSTSPVGPPTGYEGLIANFRWITGSSAYGPDNSLYPTTPLNVSSNTRLLLLATSLGTAYADATGDHTVTNHGTTWSSFTPFPV